MLALVATYYWVSTITFDIRCQGQNIVTSVIAIFHHIIVTDFVPIHSVMKDFGLNFRLKKESKLLCSGDCYAVKYGIQCYICSYCMFKHFEVDLFFVDKCAPQVYICQTRRFVQEVL